MLLFSGKQSPKMVTGKPKIEMKKPDKSKNKNQTKNKVAW